MPTARLGQSVTTEPPPGLADVQLRRPVPGGDMLVSRQPPVRVGRPLSIMNGGAGSHVPVNALLVGR